MRNVWNVKSSQVPPVWKSLGKTKKAKERLPTLFSTFNHSELSGIVTGAKTFVYI